MEWLTLDDSVPHVVVIADSSDMDVFGRNDREINRTLSVVRTVVHLDLRPGLPGQKNDSIEWAMRNLEASSRKYYFFLDDDVFPEQGYFSAGRLALIEDGSAFMAGGYDPSYRPPARTLLRRLLGFSEKRGGIITRAGFAEAPFDGELKHLEPLQWAPGGMQCIAGWAVEEHGFDGRIRIHGEDLEVCLRLAERGCGKIIHVRGMRAIHKSEASGKGPSFLQVSQMHGFRWRISSEYPSRVSRPMVLVAVFSMLARDAVRWISGSHSWDSTVRGHVDFIIKILRRQPTHDFVRNPK